MARRKKDVFEEKTFVDKIEITSNDMIQVRERYQVLKNGVEISSNLHRHVLQKGDDLSSQDLRVQQIAAVVWGLD